MTNAKEQALSDREIFQRAVMLPTCERAAYLDQACGDDLELRQEVESLLQAYDSSSDFMEQPAIELSAEADGKSAGCQPITEGPGTAIGPYKLLEEIGEGGFGVVFMAEQERPVRRRIALKIIRPGMDTREVIARFEAERQALAMMEHPNIARVFDAGATESGRPYFVMELVQGVPINQYCDRCSLTTRERLELFVTVCQAIQHAHQKGVIHRDMKPTNVLVAMQDGRATTKIIDFGVAKAINQRLTDLTLITGFTQMVGTPMYMSPEQAELSPLGVDTRSDIYSLGVLLYELLTGTTPFERDRLHAAAYDELRRIIREEEPPCPSARISTLAANLVTTIAEQRRTDAPRLLQAVRGELDWIVMKCLEKDRNRRYESASGLAEDVRRYLRDEPVLACRPSTAYRLRKFARRNRPALMMGSVIALALLSVLAVVAGSIGWTARDRAARGARLAGHVELILQEVDRLANEQKWPEALASANRAMAILQSGEASRQIEDRARQALTELQLVQQLEDAHLLSTQWTEGKFNYVAADRAYARAFADASLTMEGVSVEQAADQLRAHPRIIVPLATALTDWADARLLVKERDSSTCKHLLAVASAIDPDPWRQRLRAAYLNKDGDQAIRDLADSADIRSLPSATVRVLATWLRERATPVDASHLLSAVQRHLPGDFWVNFELALHLQTKANRLEDAVAYYRVAHALRPTNGSVLNNLGSALKDLGKLDEAVASYHYALEIDPAFPSAHYNLGIALHAQRKLDEAIAAYRRAIELDPNYAYAHNNLGIVLKEQKKFNEAMVCFRKAIEIDPNVVQAHDNLGWALKDTGKAEEAIPSFQRAIELDPEYARAYYGLGTSLSALGKLDEAVASLRRAIALNPKDAQFHNNLGTALHDQQQFDEAITCFREAIELDPKLPPPYLNLSQILMRQGHRDEGLTYLIEGVELCESNPQFANFAPAYNMLAWQLATFPDPEVWDAARAVELAQRAVDLAPKQGAHWNTLGVAQYRAGDWQAAITALEKSIELRDGGDSSDFFFLAMAHWQLGHKDKSRKWYEQAIEWMEKNDPDNDELQRFRAEAAELLGIAEPRAATNSLSRKPDGAAGED